MKLKKSDLYFNTFYKTKGWTGADGVYTHIKDDLIIWYFSDTFIGEVDDNQMRKEGFVMKNHSFGYSLLSDPFNITFDYPSDNEYLKTSPNVYHC